MLELPIYLFLFAREVSQWAIFSLEQKYECQILVFILTCWKVLPMDWYVEHSVAHCVFQNSYVQIFVLTSYGTFIFQKL